MPEPATPVTDAIVSPAAGYAGTSSERFQKAFADLGALALDVFPSAESIFQWDMPGWKINLVPLDDPNYRGTMDPNFFAIMLVERKSGLTLHIWNPRDYYGLSRSQSELGAAGFKVMRGCLVFNRKQPYPIAAVGDLLRNVRERLGDAVV